MLNSISSPTSHEHREAIPAGDIAKAHRIDGPHLPSGTLVVQGLKNVEKGHVAPLASPVPEPLASPVPEPLITLVKQFSPIFLAPKSCAYNVPRAADFDGDWNVTNNQGNYRPGQSQQAEIYFNVIASKTHVFIDYYLFYPVDGGVGCMSLFGHKNDASSVRLIVRKSQGHEPAALEKLITSDHGKVQVYDPASLNIKGARAVIEITTGTHAMTPMSPGNSLPASGTHFRFNAEDSVNFISIHDTLWNRRTDTQVFTVNGQFVGKRAPWAPWARNFSLPEGTASQPNGFFKPIEAYKSLYNGAAGTAFSNAYEYNPFLEP